MGSPVLEAVALTKEFSGVRVLNQVNVALERGEVLGVIGENGAGKSTFMKIVSGIYSATSGRILLDGTEVEVRDPVSAKQLGISMVPQEFNLVDSLTVFENVFLGYELRLGGSPLLDKDTMRERTRAILDELETNIAPDAKIRDLSVALRQMVEIAKAVVHDSRILILDEPTTMLNPKEVEILFRLIRSLKERGVAIVFISHKLHEVKTICDRVLILRDGDQISLTPTSEISTNEMAKRMVGRELNQVFPEKRAALDEVILKVDHLTVPGLIEDISFELRRGEVLGFAGLVGAGRTETMEAVMGLRYRSEGEVSVRGRAIEAENPRAAVDAGVAYLSEDRQGRGIVMNFDVTENVTLISLAKYIRVLINGAKTQQVADDYVERFNIRAASLKAKLRYFSGGNQQKVYLAKWMDTDPVALILDEPTRGIDVNAKMEIYRFVRQLADEGIACLVISSELEEIIGLCTRVVVMREGKLTGVLSGDEINEEEIMYHATGVKEGRIA